MFVKLFLLNCICNFLLFVECSTLTNKLKVKLESSTRTSTTITKIPEVDKDGFDPQVISETNKILVVNGHCNLINRFSLSNNFSYDCRLKYLPIDFLLRHHTGNENVLTAYLHSNNELYPRQEISNSCQKIRRYLNYNLFLFLLIKSLLNNIQWIKIIKL